MSGSIFSSTVKRKRRRQVRNVEDDFKQKLIAVREVYRERLSFSIFGIHFLCPDSTINNICKEAKYIESAEDAILLRVRPELRDKFFNVIADTSSYCTSYQGPIISGILETY